MAKAGKHSTPPVSAERTPLRETAAQVEDANAQVASFEGDISALIGEIVESGQPLTVSERDLMANIIRHSHALGRWRGSDEYCRVHGAPLATVEFCYQLLCQRQSRAPIALLLPVASQERCPDGREPATQHIAANLAGSSSMLAKVQRWRELFDDLKLRRGRPPEYDRAAITAIARDVIKRGVDDHLDWYVERVANDLRQQGYKVPKSTMLTEICAPIYKSVKAGE
jgi:hypothetical protein